MVGRREQTKNSMLEVLLMHIALLLSFDICDFSFSGAVVRLRLTFTMKRRLAMQGEASNTQKWHIEYSTFQSGSTKLTEKIRLYISWLDCLGQKDGWKDGDPAWVPCLWRLIASLQTELDGVKLQWQVDCQSQLCGSKQGSWPCPKWSAWHTVLLLKKQHTKSADLATSFYTPITKSGA